MANLTEKELSALEDQLNYEQVLIKKYKGCVLASPDPFVITSKSSLVGCECSSSNITP